MTKAVIQRRKKKVMAKQQFMIKYTPELLQEPIIYNLGQQFSLITNIIRADIAEDKGWMLLELEGTKDDIEQGIAWAISRGARVNPVD